MNCSLSEVKKTDFLLESCTIEITPSSFKTLLSDVFVSTNKKWFLNISNQPIPSKVSNLLQLGDRFSLQLSSNRSTMVHEFIKDIECNIRRLDNDTKFKIRNSVVTALTEFYETENDFFACR